MIAVVSLFGCGGEIGVSGEKPNQPTDEDAVMEAGASRDMEAVLREISTRTDQENDFIGDALARHLRKMLAQTDAQKEPGPYLHTLLALGNAEVVGSWIFI